jgi:energy-coupling factor transporter transmembrane protein EcfT
LLITLLLIVYVFPAHPVMIAIWVAAFAFWIYLSLNKKLTGKLFWMPAIAMIIINFFITNQVYFTLLKYQIGSQAGKYIRYNTLASKDIALFRVEDPLNCIDFYANDTIHGSDSIKDLTGKKYIITMDKGLKTLQENGFCFDILKQGQSYKVSELTPEFLNPATRKSTTKEYYILKVK